MDKNEFAANVLYNDAKLEEKKWRRKNHRDSNLIEKMLNDINVLGYDFKFLADLTYREIFDFDILRIIQNYIGTFLDDGISAELIGIIGVKKNIGATETIIKNYENCSMENRHRQAGFYDNALYTIKDKRFIKKYLEFAKNKGDVIRLPLTMTLLAKWNVPEAKGLFLSYLDAKNSDLMFVAIECLSNFKNDATVIEALNSIEIDNIDIQKAKNRALSKITKYR